MLINHKSFHFIFYKIGAIFFKIKLLIISIFEKKTPYDIRNFFNASISMLTTFTEK